jgi:hypothetical protein
MGFIINIVIVLVVLGVMYALASEGLWGAALMFFNVLFAGLIAFNFYEPLAEWLITMAGPVSNYADTLCLLGIFGVSLVLLRITTETLAPQMVRFPMPVYNVGRWVFGLAAGWMLVSILLLAFYTSPVQKKVFGVVNFDTKPPFGRGIDRDWLAFFQYTTGYVFADYKSQEKDPEFGYAAAFDPRGEWLIHHQEARYHGDGPILETGTGGGEAGAAGKEGADPQGPAPPGSTIGGPTGAAAGVAAPN